MTGDRPEASLTGQHLPGGVSWHGFDVLVSTVVRMRLLISNPPDTIYVRHYDDSPSRALFNGRVTRCCRRPGTVEGAINDLAVDSRR